MSRSYRKTPIIGMTNCNSEKRWKRYANRALRRTVKVELARGNWESLPLLREISNVWAWGKDGKQYVHLALEPDYKAMGK